jgi:hypothetical protein
MLDAHAAMGRGRQARVSPPPCLNTGLLVGRDHEVGLGQRLALPTALVQVEHSARLFLERRIAREKNDLENDRAGWSRAVVGGQHRRASERQVL